MQTKKPKKAVISKCYICGKPTKYKITVEPKGDSLYVCKDIGCTEDVYLQLDHAGIDYQGRRRSQVEHAELVGAVSLILMIAYTVGVLVYTLLTSR
jgi:hypothetical protein